MHNYNIKLHLAITFAILLFNISHICTDTFDDSNYDPLKAWNLPDATAFPEHAFIYELPNDFHQFEVTELELNFMPEWLEYDSARNRLVGVAGQDDIGKMYFMEVKPSQELWHSSAAPPIDVFKIEVEDLVRQELLLLPDNEDSFENFHNSQLHESHNSFGRVIYCKKNKPVTTTSIVIDLDHDDNLSVFLKVLIIERFSNHYEIPLKAIKIVSYNEVNDINSHSNSVLVAGPGDYKRDKKAVKKNNVVLHWTVGCGSVQKKHLSALQRLETEAKEGVLREVLKYSVVGWFVTNNKPKEIELKQRRYLQNHFYPTSTATISILPPSSTYTTTANTVETTKALKLYQGNLQLTNKPATTWASEDFKATRSLNVFKVFVGEVFKLAIHEDWFTRSFKHLSLTSMTHQALPASSWLKLNSRNALYGLPLWSHQGEQQYLLDAMDEQGTKTSLKVGFNVVPAELKRAPYEMSVVIDNLDFERFTEEVDVRMDVTRKLASAFGDADSSDMLMTRVSRGSVDYSWTNKSMLLSTLAQKHRGCSVKMVNEIFSRVVNASNGHLKDSFSRSMKGYEVSYAEALPSGDCEKFVDRQVAHFIGGERVLARDRTSHLNTNIPSYDSTDAETSQGGSVQYMDELLKQILVPTVIVVVLVLLALIIACVAFNIRSSRKGDKLKVVDDCIRKGTPVIFAHELDDNPPTMPSKRPLITSAQRSPRPPNYRQHMISATSKAGNLTTAKLFVPN